VEMCKNNRDIIRLHAEIKELKKILRDKVQQYGEFSHPAVVAVSNKLDQKIYACMRLSHLRHKNEK
jgi:hypothetical protein